MSINFFKCTPENKQIEEDCASGPEIDEWMKNHLITTWKSSDAIDFEIRDKILPVYSTFKIMDYNILSGI